MRIFETSNEHRAIMKQTATEEYKGVKMVRVNTERGTKGNMKRASRTKYFVDGKQVHGHERFVAEQFLFENFDKIVRTNEVDWNA